MYLLQITSLTPPPVCVGTAVNKVVVLIYNARSALSAEHPIKIFSVVSLQRLMNIVCLCPAGGYLFGSVLSCYGFSCCTKQPSSDKGRRNKTINEGKKLLERKNTFRIW